MLTDVNKDAEYSHLADGSSRELIFIVHDALGSRLDFAHVAKVLASLGFVVAATEYDDSMSTECTANDFTFGTCGHRGNDDGDARRTDVLKGRAKVTRDAIRDVRSRFEVAKQMGLIGHGTYDLSRCVHPFVVFLIAVVVDGNRVGRRDDHIYEPTTRVHCARCHCWTVRRYRNHADPSECSGHALSSNPW